MSAQLVERLYKSLYSSTHNKIICAGRNFFHSASVESGRHKGINNELVIFDKTFNSIMRSGEVLYLQRENKIHHGVELGFMIGMTGKNIKPEEYDKYIEGYFIGIDFTDKDLHTTARKNGSPWTMAKAQDGFLAVSGFVAKHKIRNPHDLEIQLKINKQHTQRENTRQMITQIPELISHISQYVTLREGDLIMTGTPSGGGEASAGDFIEVSLRQQNKDLANLFMKIDKIHQ
ncbi:fumarylacetoacetate hydrolase family protein [Stylonychia lemnae]|uniref:Fumarylacetoacetate hydrolase family protein n=1 Tax=Stylonychia lemnae TaxID=5949 RepID=A0A078AYC1_STYLE|nr:fumarylacetoacetate hydrolase family protein [Stylonychia lemnae]|eukprot:CDW87131.1 fumarylacetoacetate hydrolase family protein [Stylonychia lemnae]